MLDDSEQQLNNIKNSPVLNFLKATDTPEILNEEVDNNNNQVETRVSKLESKVDLLPVSNQLFQVEGLLKSLLLNQQNIETQVDHKIESATLKTSNQLTELSTQIEKLNTKTSEQLNQTNPEIKKLRAAISFLAILSISSITFMMFNQKSPIKEVVKLEKAAKVAPLKTPIKKSSKRLQLITTKFTNLRNKPSSTGKKILIVSPNTKFSIIETKYGWHKVKYENHLKKSSQIGWIYKENTITRKE